MRKCAGLLSLIAVMSLPLACSDSKPKPPTPPKDLKPDFVTGVVTLPDRAEVPAGAVVRVTLLQTGGAGDSGVTIVEQEFPVFDAKEPPLFTLRFDANKIDPAQHYVVRAKVLIDAQVKYESPAGIPVLTGGQPAHAVVPVKPAA